MVAALATLSIPAQAQTQTVYVKLADRRGGPRHGRRAPGLEPRRRGAAGHAGAAADDPDHTDHADHANDADHAHHAQAEAKPRPQHPFPPARAARQRPERRRRLASGRTNSGQKVQREPDQPGKLGAKVKSRAGMRGLPRSTKSQRPSLAAPQRRRLAHLENPGFVDALPGPSTATGVPNFIIRKFRVPPFLLPIYQAAGIEYGIRWEILAAINEIETDYGRNLNVSSAGALGWMQFMPPTWQAYGTDANKDGRKDPYNPVDAIFAAARYLKAAGYEQDVRARSSPTTTPTGTSTRCCCGRA